MIADDCRRLQMLAARRFRLFLESGRVFYEFPGVRDGVWRRMFQAWEKGSKIIVQGTRHSLQGIQGQDRRHLGV